METEPPKAAPIPNGIAIAASLAAMIGMLTLGVIAFACEMSKPLTATVHNIGKIWMPGADGIGPIPEGNAGSTRVAGHWRASFLLHKKRLLGGFWLVVFSSASAWRRRWCGRLFGTFFAGKH
jgi:hypothetical protein